MQSSNHNRVLFMTQFAILLAILAVFCFVPQLGSIPIGPIVATLGMIPVILTAILLGTGAGAVMGGFAGLFSLLVMTFMPIQPLTAFVFSPFYTLGEYRGNGWSLVICFVPRILVGVVAGLSYRALDKVLDGKRPVLIYSLSGMLGSLTNTFLVLGGIYVFFGPQYAAVSGLAYELLLGAVGMVVLTNGIPEAIISAVAACAVCPPVQKHILKTRAD